MESKLIIVFVYLILQMCVVWLIARRIKNPAIIDVAWPLGLMVCGLFYNFSSAVSLRLLIISGILIVWALRLAGYLYFTRIRRKIVDKRYIQLSSEWKVSEAFGFFMNFQLQGLLIFIISSVFLFVSDQSPASFSLLDCVALLLCVIGIVGESSADWQLQSFKKDHQGQVCNVGLWRYSRHPNYFFDWMTWCGFAVFALQAHNGWIGLISPLLLFLLMTKVTGPMTERGSIESRGDAYRAYQQKTAMFFPWFV